MTLNTLSILLFTSFIACSLAMNQIECLKNQLIFQTSINSLEENVLNSDIYHTFLDLATIKSLAERLQSSCDNMDFSFKPNEEIDLDTIDTCADSLDYLFAVIFSFKAGRQDQQEVIQDLIDFIPEYENACIADSIYGDMYFETHVENVLNERMEDYDNGSLLKDIDQNAVNIILN